MCVLSGPNVAKGPLDKDKAGEYDTPARIATNCPPGYYAKRLR